MYRNRKFEQLGSATELNTDPTTPSFKIATNLRKKLQKVLTMRADKLEKGLHIFDHAEQANKEKEEGIFKLTSTNFFQADPVQREVQRPSNKELMRRRWTGMAETLSERQKSLEYDQKVTENVTSV